MRIVIESTSKFVTLRINGVDVPARIWQGHTDSGIEIHAYITRVAVRDDKDMDEFQRELIEHAAPRPDLAAIPTRLVL